MNKNNQKFYFWIFGIMAACALVLRLYNMFIPDEISAASLANYRSASVTIGDNTFKSYLASTSEELSSGLSNVESLPAGEGMLFIFGQEGYHPFWMKDMKFDLDFVWIRDGKVVALTPNVSSAPIDQLKTIIPKQPVDFVLEINSGEIEALKLNIGDEFAVNYQ